MLKIAMRAIEISEVGLCRDLKHAGTTVTHNTI
jgi:hypothetical protein